MMVDRSLRLNLLWDVRPEFLYNMRNYTRLARTDMMGALKRRKDSVEQKRICI